MPLRKLWALLLLAPAMCLASVDGLSRRLLGGQTSLADREHRVWISAVHPSEFAAAPYSRARISCETTHPPQALATPVPLLDKRATSAKVTVSFIIGADGRVHSALILESAPGTAPFWMRYAPGAIARPRVMGFPGRPRRR